IVEQNNNDSQIDPSSISYQQGETIGILKIPKLKKELPIIEGTDEEELEKGVGHYTGTAYPLQNDQIVLSGHRDTVFRNFGELETGDTFIVELEYGKFKYEIYEMDIVPADDTTVIRSTAPDEILTVTTCYPFHYIGNAPERAIFYAKPVK
ncbi:MAG: class D sortase, partial [Bacillus sp. (in: Bacteria)]|nr:class D sortase [Bacillus sp. (in: firmicutes)]